MSKKLLKYGKFLLSMALIFCMCVPSVAATGGGSSDAFVTKEEFDATLANFNNRLTAFEAGINSKIDAQITSYLDRNGIWSKKDQDFEGNPFRRNIVSGSKVIVWCCAGDAIQKSYDWAYSDHYLGKITKSGLIFLDLAFIPDDTATINLRQFRSWWGVATGNWYADNSMLFIADVISISNDKNISKADITSNLDVYNTPDTTNMKNTHKPIQYKKAGMAAAADLYAYDSAKQSYTGANLQARIYLTQSYIGPQHIAAPTTTACIAYYPFASNSYLSKFFVEKGDVIVIATRLMGGVFTSNNGVNVYCQAQAKLDMKINKAEVY